MASSKFTLVKLNNSMYFFATLWLKSPLKTINSSRMCNHIKNACGTENWYSTAKQNIKNRYNPLRICWFCSKNRFRKGKWLQNKYMV